MCIGSKRGGDASALSVRVPGLISIGEMPSEEQQQPTLFCRGELHKWKIKHFKVNSPEERFHLPQGDPVPIKGSSPHPPPSSGRHHSVFCPVGLPTLCGVPEVACWASRPRLSLRSPFPNLSFSGLTVISFFSSPWHGRIKKRS